GDLALTVGGPTAAAAGDVADNLVLTAAHALAERVAGLRLGRFPLSKRAPDDPRLMQAARATGADVPVCLDPRARLMRGIGDILSDPLDLPRLFALLVHPGVAVATAAVCAALAAPPAGQGGPAALSEGGAALLAEIAGGRNDLEAPAIELEPAIADALAV